MADRPRSPRRGAPPARPLPRVGLTRDELLAPGPPEAPPRRARGCLRAFGLLALCAGLAVASGFIAVAIIEGGAGSAGFGLETDSALEGVEPPPPPGFEPPAGSGTDPQTGWGGDGGDGGGDGGGGDGGGDGGSRGFGGSGGAASDP